MSGTPDAQAWRRLRDALEGELVRDGEPRMVLANKHFAAGRPLPRPQALIRCRHEDDVRRALAFVRRHALPFAIRSGGHCFADLSSSDGVILDLGELAFCRRQGERLQLGPGLSGGQLAPALAHAGLAFPTGGCPWVAVGGFCLVGGFGFLGRRFGLATDRVRALTVITADGDRIVCDADDERELFWAMRGAGAAGLGIVTMLEVAPEPFPDLRICFGAWPVSEASALLRTWHARFTGSADARVNLEVGLYGPDDPEDPCVATLFGVLVGTEAETASLLADVRAALGPLAAALRTWIPGRSEAAGYLCGLVDRGGGGAWQPTRPYPRSGYQFTRSQFFEQPFSDAAIDACVRQFDEDRVYAQCRELEFIPWGGAYARAQGTTSFRHREARGMVRHTAMLGAFADARLRAESAAWVDGSRDTLAAAASGAVYQGYADPRLDDWAGAYYGDGYPRLQAVKAKMDPGDLFRHAQSIRLP